MEDSEQGYGGGAYQDRQLTAEEEEEEEVSATKQEVLPEPTSPDPEQRHILALRIYPVIKMMLTLSADQIHQVSWSKMAQDSEAAKIWFKAKRRLGDEERSSGSFIFDHLLPGNSC